MGTESLAPYCDWFSSTSVPNSGNDWLGENLSGFSDSNYDKACNKAIFTLPNATDFKENYQETLKIYAEELPAIPLYTYPQVAASHVDLSGFSLDPSAQNWLWNIEELYIVGQSQIIITNTPSPTTTLTPHPSSPAPTNTATPEDSYPNPTPD
jgi:ABC-type transport system substrate-binding protein